MHWIIQENLHADEGTKTLLTLLDRASIPHSLHKVIPFIGQIVPDIDPTGNVIVIGSYSLRHVAREKGWVPGSFDLGALTYADHVAKWGSHMLNADAVYTSFADAPRYLSDDDYFMRPVIDSKTFAGKIFNRAEFVEWWEKVILLEEDDGSDLRGSTQIMIAQPKPIQAEYRCWIVDGRLVTASLYKRGNRVIYDGDGDYEITDFAQARADEWQPARAFVIDIARCDLGLFVVETNTLNAAGFYAGDVGKIVDAIERMIF